jgi:hypothetical protein
MSPRSSAAMSFDLAVLKIEPRGQLPFVIRHQ